MSNYSVFLTKLREVRTLKGFSQRDVGKGLGCTGQYISCIENGITSLKMDDYFRICAFLDISPLQLIKYAVSTPDISSTESQLYQLSDRDFFLVKNLIVSMLSE